MLYRNEISPSRHKLAKAKIYAARNEREVAGDGDRMKPVGGSDHINKNGLSEIDQHRKCAEYHAFCCRGGHGNRRAEE